MVSRPAAGVVAALLSAGETLAVAESCTGGWLGREITSVPGASGCFWGGVIAYDNRAKTDVLGVPARTIQSCGAVSERTAEEMAGGIATLSGATWAVAITGVAGPGGGTPTCPTGTVCVAIRGPVRSRHTLALAGDREEVRGQAVRRVLELLQGALDDR